LGGPPVGTTTADADGYYYFSHNTNGNYYVSVTHPDYRWTHSPQFQYSGVLVIEHIAMKPFTARIAGPDRYDTSAEIARSKYDFRGWKTWPSVNAIVIASGEDRAAADPLAAASLLAYHNGPLLLVSSASVSWQVKEVVREICAANGAVDVFVVGGPVSVPDARLAEIESHSGVDLTFTRLTTKGDRYDLAHAIAMHVEGKRGVEPPVILVANGEDPTKFFDALSLSPIAGYRGYPILLVGENSIPSRTEQYLKHAQPLEVYIGGGPKTVSTAVENTMEGYAEVNAVDRWYGADRYKTSTAIATGADSLSFIQTESLGVAAVLTDALSGGAMIGGASNGPLVLTQGDVLTPSTGAWVTANGQHLKFCDVYGGERSVTPAVKAAIADAVP
jgi:putative cell wall-binding protein